MYSSARIVVLFVVVGAVLSSVGAVQLDDCLNKDSISCLQMELFRKAKEFFDQENIELWGGLSLRRTTQRQERKASLEAEEEVAKAVGAEQRENAIEEYAIERASRFLEERSINFNIGEAAKNFLVSSEDTEEGRGKKKKLLRSLLPFLIGIKMKLAGFLVLSYFVIALIAKKALLASLISLVVSGFIAIKKLMGQQQAPHHEVHEVAHGWVGPSYGGGGWDSYDSHGAYSNSVAHSMAYPGQKPAARYSEKTM